MSSSTSTPFESARAIMEATEDGTVSPWTNVGGSASDAGITLSTSQTTPLDSIAVVMRADGGTATATGVSGAIDSSAADAAASVRGISLSALHAMLQHDPSLFTTCDLGRLSVCSKTMVAMTEETGAWKHVFEKAAEAGKTCTREAMRPEWQKDHAKETWDGEPGLLECFAKPSHQVLSVIGYKRAARCLLSKTCVQCGTMAALANPIVMMRTCPACAETNQDIWLIAKSRAKDAFLLSDRDVMALPSASIPFSLTGKRKADGKEPYSSIHLMSQVLSLSHAKHGGEDGLAAEFGKRKRAAFVRYEKKKSSSKPPKKRPKIEQMSDRPAQHLSSLRYLCGMPGLPIPTVTSYGSGMAHSTSCKYCIAKGTTKEIAMHERLQHNAYCLPADEDAPTPCGPHEEASESISHEIDPAQELVDLLANADVEHFSSECQLPDVDFGDGTFPGMKVKRFNTNFTFAQQCKVVVDYEQLIGTEIDVNSLEIYFQSGPGTVPLALVEFQGGETLFPFEEACSKNFDALHSALGLKETSSSQLIAAFIERCLPVEEFFESFDISPPKKTSSVVYGTCDLLERILTAALPRS